MITLPIITGVTGYGQANGITTINFQCKMFDGRGILNRTFEINNYELHWYYKHLGWDQRYSPFTEFWSGATEQEKLDYLFIFLTDEKAWICSGAKGKVRNEPKESKQSFIYSYKCAS